MITPDRYANGDPANDHNEALGDVLDRTRPLARHGGDLRGIAERLDYIAGLGFTAVWLNPVLENAMPEMSYHGYSTTDFYRVDPRFGSNEELVALAEAARERGIGLIMDMIVNHSGLRHWWMADLPSDDWINQWEGHVNTNHAKTLSIDPYGAAVDRREFYDGWFVPVMPDLNQNNPLLAEYLIQNAIWWIERLGLAGVRMDTYPYAGKAFMAAWTQRVMSEFPDFNVVGEEWTNNPLIAAYWQRGPAKHDGYRTWLPSVMDFPLQIALVPALKDDEAFLSGFINIYESLANDVLYPDPHNLLIFADNPPACSRNCKTRAYSSWPWPSLPPCAAFRSSTTARRSSPRTAATTARSAATSPAAGRRCRGCGQRARLERSAAASTIFGKAALYLATRPAGDSPRAAKALSAEGWGVRVFSVPGRRSGNGRAEQEYGTLCARYRAIPGGSGWPQQRRRRDPRHKPRPLRDYRPQAAHSAGARDRAVDAPLAD